MQTDTMERINQVSAEKAELFRLGSNGRRGDLELKQRIAQISREIETLWEQRRQERAGLREGIDLLIDLSYARAYGSDFENAVAPPSVGDAEEEAAILAA